MPGFLTNSRVQIVFTDVPNVNEVINLTETSLGLNLNTIFKQTRSGAGETQLPTYVPESYPNPESWIGFISTNYQTSFLADYASTNFALVVKNSTTAGSGTGSVIIFANFENAIFEETSNTTNAQITITNRTTTGTTPTSGGNIINLVWDGARDDNGISGYQIQWRTSTSLPWSIISVTHDPTYGVNTEKSGGGFYNHSATQLVDHTFRIRVVDSIGQYSSEYKEIIAGVDDTSVILISNTAAVSAPLACSTHPLAPINQVLLSTTTIIPNVTLVTHTSIPSGATNNVFIGNDKYWRILLSGVEYGCLIDFDGKILQVVDCTLDYLGGGNSTVSAYNTQRISSSGLSSVVTSGPICDLTLGEDVYFTGTLGVGTIIYINVDNSGNLSSPLPGGNKYYIVGSSIVKISSSPAGKVLSKQSYSTVCPTVNEPCCFVKGTKVSMSDNTNKNIEDVKIGDIVITYNEETKEQEPGEVINVLSPVKSNIVEYKLSNNIIIKSTTCHPYWVVDKGWSSFNPLLTKVLYDFNVEQIEENDILLTIDNKEVIIDKITELITKEVSTYNLEILGNHTYYANGILVHNKTACRQQAI